MKMKATYWPTPQNDCLWWATFSSFHLVRSNGMRACGWLRRQAAIVPSSSVLPPEKQVELFEMRSLASCWEPEVFILLYEAIARLHLGYCMHACLENIHRLARMTGQQSGTQNPRRIKGLNPYSIKSVVPVVI